MSPPASGTLKKTYSLPARGSTTDFLSYDLAEGSYFISAASRMPAASFLANFVVRKENKVETAISIGSLASGSFPVDVALQNAGYNSVEGSLYIQ